MIFSVFHSTLSDNGDCNCSRSHSLCHEEPGENDLVFDAEKSIQINNVENVRKLLSMNDLFYFVKNQFKAK